MPLAPYGANCAVEIALPLAAVLTLMLVCAFSPRKYKSILRGIITRIPFREIATAPLSGASQ